MLAARTHREYTIGSSSPVRTPPLALHTAASLAAGVSTAAAYAARTRLAASRSPSVCLASAAGVLNSLDMLRGARLEESHRDAHPAHVVERMCACPDQTAVLAVVDALATEVLSQQELIRSLLRRLACYEPATPSDTELPLKAGIAASVLPAGSNATTHVASAAARSPSHCEREGSLPSCSPIRRQPASPASVAAAAAAASAASCVEGRDEPAPGAQPSSTPFASIAAAARRRAAVAAAAGHARAARASSPDQPSASEAATNDASGRAAGIGTAAQNGDGGDGSTGEGHGHADDGAALVRASHELLTAGLRPAAAAAARPASHRLRATPTGAASSSPVLPTATVTTPVRGGVS